MIALAILGIALGGALGGTLQGGGASELTPEQELYGSAVLAAVLLTLGLLQLPLGRRMKQWLGEAPRPARAAFEPVDLLAVIGLYVLTIALVGPAVYWLKTGEVGEIPPDFFESLGALEVLLATAAGQLPSVLYIVSVAARRPGGFAALGVRDLTPGPRTRYTIARYVVGLPMVFGLGALTAVLYLVNGQELPQQDAARLISESLASDGVMIVVLAAVVIPLLEEVMFRGFLLEFLLVRVGRVGAVVLSSALFALLHGVEVFLPIFGLAVILAVVKLRTRSLMAVWLVHALHNGSSTAILYLTTVGLPKPV